MHLDKEHHDKLVEDFKMIIDYLQNNVVSKIITSVNFQLHNNIKVHIFPSKTGKCWITITRNGNYFTIENSDIFTTVKGVSFNLFDGYNDDILYQFISCFDFIKERCEAGVEASKEIKNEIDDFSI